MKAEYLTLSDDRTVRIFWNMNALGKFSKLTGKDMVDLAEGKADVETIRTIAWLSAIEGEALDGKELKLTEIEFGRLMTMGNIVEFSGILIKQSNNDIQKKNLQKGKLPRIFYRKRV
jgi:hypothetical protein